MASSPNPYQILGAAPDADLETLKRRYRALVRENHPDIARDERQKLESTRKMGEINHAWAIVSDPVQRAAFDARLRLQQSEAQIKHQTKPTNPSSTRVAPNARQTPNPSKPKVGVPPKRAAEAGDKTPKSDKKGAVNPKATHKIKLERATQLFHREGRADEAAALCHSILRMDFRSVAARELLSEIHLGRGDLQKAVVLWEQIVMLRPQNPSFHARYEQLKLALENRSSSDRNSQAPASKPPADSANKTASINWNQVPIVTPIARSGATRENNARHDGFWGKLRAKITGRKAR